MFIHFSKNIFFILVINQLTIRATTKVIIALLMVPKINIFMGNLISTYIRYVKSKNNKSIQDLTNYSNNCCLNLLKKFELDIEL
jgi:hypothetical protein